MTSNVAELDVGFRRIKGREPRTQSIATRFTRSEERALLARAEANGLTLREWARDVLLGVAGDESRCEMEMHIFTELVGIQMLLMSALDPLLRSEKMAPEELAALYRRVQTTKATRAQELLAKRNQKRYYLPYYLRTETAGLTHPVSQYQLLYVSDGEKQGRVSLGPRCTTGFNSSIRRQAVASDAYSRGGAARDVLSHARKPSELSKQGAA